ncbi:hypothetical protein TOPH_04070 [Tolypocladium ophioglossoides CBS 100239]|uniref:Uncharacterized protein n=1 Tax=Tolypocladium ophioglossoides (strain CBS 100239) TaxID=1163406 RepID=A0A0L0NB09_TOLOC|nr:hypothetical protein TOPH_04070 [Tolypocladium ophioglossoides CBS 100239]
MASPAREAVAAVAPAQGPERRPAAFLSLAPATSSSYPQAPASRAAQAAGNAGPAVPAEPPSRRSSSGSNGSGYRVLKLGPVHWGEHLDDHKEDFHEAAVVLP